MPKLPRPTQLSIVVPMERDEKRFEETLVSVLEHQPGGSQIIAVHNGTYSDPFELAGEIEFVCARSSNLVDLVRDSFPVTRGTFVHVLASGYRATPGWLSECESEFQTVATAALLPCMTNDRRESDRIVGWQDTAGRLCERFAGPEVESPRASTTGFYLEAFTIRRRILGQLLDATAPAMTDPVAASYAFGCLLARAGWTVASSVRQRLEGTHALPIDSVSESSRGQCLAGIRTHVFDGHDLNGNGARKLGSMLHAAVLGNSSLGELFGMMRHHSVVPAMRRAIDLETLDGPANSAEVLDLPRQERFGDRAAA